MVIMLVPGWENGKERFDNYHSTTTKRMQAAGNEVRAPAVLMLFPFLLTKVEGDGG